MIRHYNHNAQDQEDKTSEYHQNYNQRA